MHGQRLQILHYACIKLRDATHNALGHGPAQVFQLCEPFTTRVVRIGSTAYGMQIEHCQEKKIDDDNTIPGGTGKNGVGLGPLFYTSHLSIIKVLFFTLLDFSRVSRLLCGDSEAAKNE